MLVLSRRRKERIILEDPSWGYRIIIECVEPRKDTTRLGFEAPNNVKIWREEVEDWRGQKPEGTVNEPSECCEDVKLENIVRSA